MGLFSKKKTSDKNKKKNFTRIFYATDVHGSEVAYRKFLNAAAFYDTDILILGGDVTGKFLIPVITGSNGSKRATVHGSKMEIKTDKDMENLIKKLGVLGYYHVVMTEEEFQKAQQDQKLVDKIFLREQYKRLAEWVKLADERFQGTNINMSISGGNDDHLEALKAIDDHPSAYVVACEGKHVKLGEQYMMLSLGISNPTPWHTPREFPEEIIREQIEKTVEGITDFTNVIFNFHAPPYGHGLDMCPELDTSKDPPAPVMHGGEQSFKPVGSMAVFEAIEKYQPLLVLAGHIHESRGTAKIGRTLVINPGSEYGEGALRGALVNLADGKVLSWQMTSG